MLPLRLARGLAGSAPVGVGVIMPSKRSSKRQRELHGRSSKPRELERRAGSRTTTQTLKRTSLVAAALPFAAGGATGFVLTSSPLAGASTMPSTNWSWYIRPSATDSEANTDGCNQAEADASVGQDSLVTLDFGAQTADGTGTLLPATTTEWLYATDQGLALAFAGGYQACESKGTFLTLGLTPGLIEQ
jgi:hypothetical protein